jgi:hypothetical protein
MHRYGRIDENTYISSKDNIEYFIKGEKAPPKENEEELTDADLDEMISEMNDDSGNQAKSTKEPVLAPEKDKETETN